MEVEPGAHRLCSRWQTCFNRLTDEVSLNNFVAEPGRIDFVGIQITVQSAGDEGYPTIDPQPISEDEGRLLVSAGAESISRVK